MAATTFSAAPDDVQRIKLELEKGEDTLRVFEFTVHERMSSPFVVQVVARSPHADIDLEQVVGFAAGLGYRSEDRFEAGWTGVCTHMELVQTETSATGLSTYHLTLSPHLWLLTQRRGHRIYQHLDVPSIVKKIFGEYKLEATWDLDDSYPKHEYEVQYDESDFAFVSRLLEEAGISYLFEKVTAGDTVRSKLVLRDHPEKVASVGAVRFHDQPSAVRSSTFVTDVHLGHDVRPGKVTLRDYDLRKPLFDLTKESAITFGPGEEPEQKYETYRYLPGVSLIEATADGQTPVADEHGPGRHMEDEDKARAQRWAEADRQGKRYVQFDANERRLAPGIVFSIDEHPHTEVGADKLLVVETITHGDLQHWTLLGVAVFVDEVRYRPLLITPKPRVMGLQTAIVVGPPGKEIHTDEFGRARVRFHWDREGKFDDNAACWLRVSQQWAGAGFGWMLVPRVGQEVLVDFLEGDPNQPVLIGRLHSLTTVVPRALPKHMTQSTLRTATTPLTDGWFNEIMMDDEAGKELLFVQAQRDLYKLVKHDETERTFKDRTVVVGAARVAAVAAHDSVQVGKQHLIKVVNAGDLHIPDLGDPQTTPTTTFMEVVDKKITLTTGQATVVLDGGDIGIEAQGALRFSSDGAMIVQGSTIYLNQQQASVAKPSADKKVVDPVRKPDRMLGVISELFWPKLPEETLSHAIVGVTVGPGDDEEEAPGGAGKPAPAKKFDSKGEITPEYYEWLRPKTPNKARRDAVNAEDPPRHDPVYGQVVVGKLQADHIVPMKEIVAMTGFNKLTTEQHIALLNLPANFWGLSGGDGGSNQSKGGKNHAEWIAAGGLGGAGLSKKQEKLLMDKDAVARAALKAAIKKPATLGV